MTDSITHTYIGEATTDDFRQPVNRPLSLMDLQHLPSNDNINFYQHSWR
jgi:hypothetical protein